MYIAIAIAHALNLSYGTKEHALMGHGYLQQYRYLLPIRICMHTQSKQGNIIGSSIVG